MTAIPARGEGEVVHRKRPNRSVRATLNALAALVDYTARIVIQLVLAPLMLGFLGATGYGVWQVLQRLIGHATPAGGRPGEALKWVVAQTQTSDDDERKRRQVGTAIVVWALFIPFTAVLGAVLAWFAPSLVHAQPDQVWTVRVAAALLVVNLIVLGLAGVPQSVLQGENLGYRRLGLSTAILFVGALLMWATLWAGWGVVGLTVATIAATVLSGITYLRIVRSQVRWWGVARPPRGSVRGFVSLSWWFMLWNLVMQAVKGSDVIVLGAVAGAAVVTTYTLTLYVPQAVGELVFMVISATMPGLGGLVGAGQLNRAARVRAETMVLAWLVGIGSAATAIVWLPAFLDVWVGSKFYAGPTQTVLICVMMLQLALIRVDSNVIDLTLRVRGKVLLGLLSAALSAGLGYVLAGPAGLGIGGLAVGFMLGRIPLTIAYPVLVGRLLGLRARTQVAAIWRPALTSVALLAGAAWLRDQTGTPGWVPLILLGSLTAAAMLLLAYLAGLSASQRVAVRSRAMKVVRRS
jgi:O-antigen/teichoic acid export membrane protein